MGGRGRGGGLWEAHLAREGELSELPGSRPCCSSCGAWWPGLELRLASGPPSHFFLVGGPCCFVCPPHPDAPMGGRTWPCCQCVSCGGPGGGRGDGPCGYTSSCPWCSPLGRAWRGGALGPWGSTQRVGPLQPGQVHLRAVRLPCCASRLIRDVEPVMALLPEHTGGCAHARPGWRHRG